MARLVALLVLSACAAGSTTADAPGPVPCEPGRYGADCAATCDCAAGAACRDGAAGDGACVCPPDRFGARCDGVCACDNGGHCDAGANGSGACTCRPGFFGAACAGTCACSAERCDDGAGGSGACSAVTLTVTLDRDDTSFPYPIIVEARARDEAGGAVRGLPVSVTASGGTVSPVIDRGDGSYRAVVTPQHVSGELPIDVTAGDVTVHSDAVVLPFVASHWGQPEKVPGLVNTAAYEDSAEVSPDGEWLIVSSYSPVDAMECLLVCLPANDPFCDACQTVIGPYAAPERPGMLGASRIQSPTRITNSCPSLCLPADGSELTNVPLIPVAAFGFRRQSDGSFREPFVIGAESDGCNAPFGFSFTRSPSGTSAEVIMAFEDPGSGTRHDVYWAPLTLGEPNILARFSCAGGTITVSDATPSRLLLDSLDGAQGNPMFSSGWLFYDDEYTSSPPALFVARATGALPTATFAPASPLPVAVPSDDLRQPHFTPPLLYFTRNLSIASSRLDGSATAGPSWTEPAPELTAESGSLRAGGIRALGEPSLAHRPDGSVELYFVYGRNTGTSLDMSIGRVTRRRVVEPPDETIVIDAAATRGAVSHRASGTLLGLSSTAPTDDFIDPLAPQMFRTAAFYNALLDPYDRMSARAPVTLALGLKEEHTCAGCGECTTCSPLPGEGGSWTAWEGSVNAVLDAAATANETYAWDVWNEPDLVPWPDAAVWSDSARFLETWRRTAVLIRGRLPNATIVGPSPSRFVLGEMLTFLNYSAANGVLPDVVSWHEFGPSFGFSPPDQIPAHVQAIRDYSGGFLARYSINEWMGIDDRFSPGIAAWFIANLERAGVESAARTCWGAECFDTSLGGLLLPGGFEPRSVWWAHATYGALAGQMVAVQPSASFDGVAAAAGGELVALLGHHGGSWLTSEMRVRGLSGTCARVVLAHIPNSETEPLAAPLVVRDDNRAVTDGELRLRLPASGPGDAWRLDVAPCP